MRAELVNASGERPMAHAVGSDEVGDFRLQNPVRIDVELVADAVGLADGPVIICER